MVAYLVAIFLYWHNGDAGNDDTVRWYIRRVEGEEESWAIATGVDGGPTSRQLNNKGCWLCHRAVANVIHETTWWRTKWPPPPAQV
jgi:hypothetical protein